VLESHFKYVPPVVTATGAVVGAVPEMAHDSAPPPKVKKAKKVVVEAPAAVVAEPVAAEKPKKVKKAKVALSEAEIFEKALKAIESDPALAKLAFLAVKACRHKIQTEIGEIQAVVDPLLAQIECKRALLAEITE
jgi:hypothetical protein